MSTTTCTSLATAVLRQYSRDIGGFRWVYRSVRLPLPLAPIPSRAHHGQRKPRSPDKQCAVIPSLQPLQLHPPPALIPGSSRSISLSPSLSKRKIDEWPLINAVVHNQGREVFGKLDKSFAEERKQTKQARKTEEKREEKDEEKEKRHGGLNPWKVKQNRFTKHITTLIQKGKVQEAQKVYGEMIRERVRPDMSVFNNLIAGVSRDGDIKSAFKYFNNLKKRGLHPTNHTYTSLFKACAEMGPTSLPILQKIISEIDRRDVLLNTIASNSLITALSKCGLVDEAFQVYFDMSKRDQKPDVTTFTSLLSACAGDGEEGMGRVGHVWSEMDACGVTPDLFCYNTLLRCVREAGIPEDMKHFTTEEIVLPELSLKRLLSPLDHGEERGHSVKTSSRSDYISRQMSVVSKVQVPLRLSGRSGVSLTLHLTGSGWRWLDAESVEGFLNAVEERGMRPDVHTLHLLSILVPDWEVVVRRVSEAGVVLDAKSVVAAARLQSHLDNAEGAEVLRRLGEERGLALGLAGYQAVAISCHTMKQGKALLDTMKEDGVTPDQYIIGTLLGNAAFKRQYDYLVYIMKEMRHQQISPNEVIIRILEKAIGRVPQSSTMKLRYDGFKGYYVLWKRHYPDVSSGNDDAMDISEIDLSVVKH